MISLSSTVTILSIFSLTMSKVNFPGVFTEIPSAMVVFPLTVSSELLSSDFSLQDMHLIQHQLSLRWDVSL